MLLGWSSNILDFSVTFINFSYVRDKGFIVMPIKGPRNSIWWVGSNTGSFEIINKSNYYRRNIKLLRLIRTAFIYLFHYLKSITRSYKTNLHRPKLFCLSEGYLAKKWWKICLSCAVLQLLLSVALSRFRFPGLKDQTNFFDYEEELKNIHPSSLSHRKIRFHVGGISSNANLPF